MLKISKRLIVVPDLLFDYISDSFIILARMFSEKINGKVIKYSDFDPNQHTDIVFSMGAPSRTFDGSKFWHLKTKLFVYWIDDMGWKNPERRADFRKTIERADLILCVNPVKFSLLWDKYLDKIAYFPFYAPDYFLADAPNAYPIMKCLLAGRLAIGQNTTVYPIRQKVFHAQMPEIEVLPHPTTTQSGIEKQKFAEELAKYFCCVTDSHRTYYDFIQDENIHSYFNNIEKAKKQGQVVKKYFEIPATGSLLIADGNTEEEMKKLGFQNGQNYIQVTEENVLDVIAEVLKNPEKYQAIRQEGLQFIKNNHRLMHREKLFSQIMSAYV